MKKIVTHLKENWIRHAFETLVVAVGILAAFTLSSWNQNRIQSKEEQRLLTVIFEEMATLRFQQGNGATMFEDTKAAAQRLLIAINNPLLETSKELIDLDLYLLSNRWLMGQSNSTTTYDALIGSGEFGLISSRELRNLLADLKLQIDLLANYEELQTTFVDNRLNPLLNQYVDGVYLLELGSGKMQTRYANPPIEFDSLIESSRFNTSYEELFANKEFSNLLVELYKHTSYLTRINYRISGFISRIDSILIVENPALKEDSLAPAE